uniref:Uncharacterized protein n=1 Tax=Anguilla anguilla TaxID=7936 RepID=A0A0E9S183_ANGAN
MRAAPGLELKRDCFCLLGFLYYCSRRLLFQFLWYVSNWSRQVFICDK